MSLTNDTTAYGGRLLPQIIDERAKAGYTRPFAMYSKSSDPSAGFHSINYAQMANAVNRVAWWLDSEFSSQEKEKPFAYFGPNDLRHIIFLMAVMKTERRLLLASPRNTIKAQLSLFQKTDCNAIVLCSSLDLSFQPLIAASGLRHIQAPRLDELLAGDPVPHYEYNMTWENSSTVRFMTLHTSGSSGDPKPISIGKYFMGAIDSGNCLPDNQGQAVGKLCFSHQNILALLPGFHAGGIAVYMMAGFYEVTLVLGHPDVPMSSGYVAELLRTGPITVMTSPPSILEDLSKDAAALQALSKLKHIAYVGGPLRPDAGNILAVVVPHIFSLIGATEVGWFHCLAGSNDVWDSLRYFDNIGYRFDEVSEGMFEHVIVNDEKTNVYHGVFEVFPKLQEYRTKDLYSRHPTVPGWLRYRGRADDLIMLSNGEKINPIPMENKIGSHPSVRSALVIGDYRFNATLLVELKEARIPRTEDERHERLDEIWLTIQEANDVAPKFARIPKSLVIFTTAEKPFLRAGKGTVQRQQTVRAYAKELDEIYSSQESTLLTEGLTLIKSDSLDDIKIFVQQICKQALGDEKLSDFEDIFQKGMDSLGVATVARRLKAALEACSISLDLEEINPRMVYSSASVDKLVYTVMTLIDKKRGVSYTNGVTPSRIAKMENMLEKYSKNMPEADSKHSPSPAAGAWTVLLTGTTGSLGTHLLAALDRMPKPKIGRIVCMNRSADAKERQRKLNMSRDIEASWHDCDDSKVEFLQADFSKANLGLDSGVYADLLREATVIIHSAWQVDFNLSIDSFEPQIRGVRNLLEFSSQSANKAPLIFVSSISTALQWMDSHPSAKVPESIISDFDAPEQIGYGESKFVSEHLLERFSAASGVTTAVLRTGQIAGLVSDNGMWNKREWLPSIIASSKYLGVLPESLAGMNTVDWVPVDLLSTMIVGLAEQVVFHKNEASQGTIVYNLVNPQTTTWHSLLPAVQASIGVSKVVSFHEWVQALHQNSFVNNGAIIEANPGVKLIDFYRSLSEKQSAVEGSKYAVDNLMRDSNQASDLTAVSPDWIRRWLRQWSF